MEQTMTIDEVLKVTKEMLGKIEIQITMTEKIGIPVSRAIHNLDECINAMEAAKAKQEAPAEPEAQEEANDGEADAE